MIYIFCKYLLFYLLPFIIATLIARAVQKPAKLISLKTKLNPKIIAPVLAALFCLAAAFAVLYGGYRITLSLGDVLSRLPALSNSVISSVSRLQKRVNDGLCEISPYFAKQVSLFAKEILKNIRGEAGKFFSAAVSHSAKKAPAFLINCIVTAAASCFIAKDFNGLLKFFACLCGKRVYGNIIKIKNIIRKSVFDILKGYLLLTVITFGELTVFLSVIGIKHAPLWAFFTALIDLLPVLGTGAVLIPWSAAEFFTGNGKIAGGLIAIYVIITIVRNFAEPKIIGDKTGINPLFTLLLMFFGLKLLGFAGLFILPTAFIVIIKYYKAEEEPLT